MNKTEENALRKEMKTAIAGTAVIIPHGQELDEMSTEELTELYDFCKPLFDYMNNKGFRKQSGYRGRRED